MCAGTVLNVHVRHCTKYFTYGFLIFAVTLQEILLPHFKDGQSEVKNVLPKATLLIVVLTFREHLNDLKDLLNQTQLGLTLRFSDSPIWDGAIKKKKSR